MLHHYPKVLHQQPGYGTYMHLPMISTSTLLHYTHPRYYHSMHDTYPLTLFWISGMHYHGAYYFNCHMWLKDSSLITPSSHLVWSLSGQESVNTSTLSSSLTPSCDSFYTGIPITTGFFHLWHSAGIYSIQHL